MIARGSSLFSAGFLLFVVAVGSSCGDSAAPPQPTTLMFVTPPPASAETMVPLTTQPVVQTVDAHGNPAGGQATVNVAVIGATGIVAANGTATTNTSGLATFSNLTLGAVHGAVGTVTLQFSATGLQPITATVELHCAMLPMSIGQSVNRSLSDGDCISPGGSYYNLFALTTTQPVTAVGLGMSGAFRGTLSVKGANEPLYFWGYTSTGNGPNNGFSYKVLLPAGQNLIRVSSVDQLGAYNVNTSLAPEDLKCDNAETAVASPITTSQQLGDGDCIENSFLEDGVVFGLPPNATVNATMTSSAFDPQIKVLNASTRALVASSTSPASTSVTFTNTDAAATPYVLVLTSSVSQMSGRYNLTFNITYPSSASAATTSFTLPLFETTRPYRTPPWAGARRAAIK